jgi:hypothetical protein
MAYKEGIGENGQLPDSVLKRIDTGQKLYIPAADSFMRMRKDAIKDGVYIKLVGQFSGYRPCGEQGDYLQRRCSTGFTQWCAWEKYKSGVGNLAANPTTSKGCTSNHGFGIAIDVENSDGKRWIRKNGEKYGWWWGEAPSEDWHFTYDIKRDKYLKLQEALEDIKESVDEGVDFGKRNWLPIVLVLAGLGGLTFYLIKSKTIKL